MLESLKHAGGAGFVYTSKHHHAKISGKDVNDVLSEKGSRRREKIVLVAGKTIDQSAIGMESEDQIGDGVEQRPVALLALLQRLHSLLAFADVDHERHGQPLCSLDHRTADKDRNVRA